MGYWTIAALAAALAVTMAAALLLGWALRREAARRAAGDAALAARIEGDAARGERLALFERRRAAIAPLDALHLGWLQGGRPRDGEIAEALAALEAARLLFPAETAAMLGEASRLLADYAAARRWRHADGCARRTEREQALERERWLEAETAAAVAALRTRLADAARLD